LSNCSLVLLPKGSTMLPKVQALKFIGARINFSMMIKRI
jgi:hypothetical protein